MKAVKAGSVFAGVAWLFTEALLLDAGQKCAAASTVATDKRDGNNGYPGAGLPMLFWWRSFPGRAHSAIMQLFSVKALPFSSQITSKSITSYEGASNAVKGGRNQELSGGQEG